MHNLNKALTFILSTIVIFLFGLLFLITHYDQTLCRNEIYHTTLSPDEILKAVIFERNCGATTGFSTHVSIIATDSDLENESGNIYILKGHPLKVAPLIRWQTNDQLDIARNKKAETFKAEVELQHIRKVTIKYRG